jgi:hypothetical protein
MYENRNGFKSIVDSHLKRIANILLLNSSFINNLGLLNGKMGVAIFFYHYSVYSGNYAYKDFAKDLISDIYQEINGETPIDFANGLTGIGWSLKYLVNRGFICDENEVKLVELDRSIYLNSLKTPLILVNNEDICSYGLYYLSRLHELKNDDSLNTLVKKQLLIYLHDDIERMMTNEELIGFEVPKLTINQLNSLVYFLCKMQELQLFPVKETKIEKLLPMYIMQKVELSDSIIENYTLKKLLEILCGHISNQVLLDDYNNILISLEEKIKYDFQRGSDLKKGLNILAWYSLIYPIEYYNCTNFMTLINTAFTEVLSEINWCQTMDKISNGKIGLSNGIAGHGLVLMNHTSLI